MFSGMNPRKYVRAERARCTIVRGNLIQAMLFGAGVALLWLCAQPIATALQVVTMLIGYLLIYFSTHASAHWLVGRLAGIRFTHYSVGGSTHTSAYPPGMRQVFERLPFFAAHAGKASLQAASPIAQAVMFGAGMTSSVVCCTLAALWCWQMHAPGGFTLFIVNAIWFAAAIVAEARQGDYAKAARALAPSPGGRGLG
jgi:hypothetical protein